jgi:hypothetical protein
MASGQRFSAAEVAQAAMQSHGLVTLTAQRLGCASRTVHYYASRYETVRAAIRAAREATADMVESRLIAAAEAGEPWAIMYYAKTQMRDRGYGEMARVDLYVQPAPPELPASMEIDYDDFNRRTEHALRLVARIQRGEAVDEDEDPAPADDDGDDVA